MLYVTSIAGCSSFLAGSPSVQQTGEDLGRDGEVADALGVLTQLAEAWARMARESISR